ncbi:MAG TPA: aspartate kinase [Chitinophagaceae bacterium]|nr:aspartate kinase [Chitinophagaceae bacterium]HMW67154.1 aspartate kinase [Chitinophagaceae bacterium]HNA18835.1 aspartate kinase [Chitinophagaceae bacterium]HNA90901.1 aspartate kinase [Chitinophagaceae bacterium]HNA96225.1 aspartate kinase [Chitinophagaceae bacterium]
MKVFKFGGASVNSVERVQNLVDILQNYNGEKLLIVVSAMGKTTNALEKVVNAFYESKNAEALELFATIKRQHLNTAKYLLVTHFLSCENQLRDFFTEAEWLLHDKPVKDYDYYYDQLVCTGELFSTCIVSHFLNEKGISNKWIDVRDVFRTDDDFRDADIDWEITTANVRDNINPLFAENNIVLTQGFIGATDENESTTLGREGSDFSAAVFANLLDAESLTIWKDVESVMNADPKQFSDAIPIPVLNFNEVIEMAYYGAQIIHPKTIKPLQNKNIPLFVKSFIDPNLAGTIIHNKVVHQLPPIIVLKENQVMLQMSSRDFSFIGEHYIGRLYQLFESLHLKPNLTQNGAISFLCVFDDRTEKLEKLALDASAFLDVQVMRNLSLLTIRHFHKEIFEKLTIDKKILLRQQTQTTIQVLMQ